MRPTPIFTRPRAWALALGIALATLAAYSNSFYAPFLLDDLAAIVQNPSIHAPFSPWRALFPPPGSVAAGRPVTNLSFAINQAISGNSVWSYHAVNLAIHVAAALVLFFILRKALASSRMHGAFDGSCTVLAFFCSLIWAVHPLQTESVTYIFQRSESLMGLLFLATLGLSIKGWEKARPWPWHLAALGTFALCLGVKEVIVAAPFCVFFYDAVFVSQNARKALARSPLLYGGFAVGLVLLALGLAFGNQAARITPHKAAPLEYLATQPKVIAYYLQTALWPGRLCLDLSWPVMTLRQTWPHALLLLGLASATAWALWRKMPLGFAGACFFLILAPTSSFFPLLNLAFEHRMYLPLAPVVVACVCGGFVLAKRILPARAWTSWAGYGGVALLLAVSLALAAATHARNTVYQSQRAIWEDTLAKAPGNWRAHLNLGYALAREGNTALAITHYRQAARLCPNDPIIHFNLANMLMREGKKEEAIAHYQMAVAIYPGFFQARHNLGAALAATGDFEHAVLQLREAVRLSPGSSLARASLARVLSLSQKTR